MSDMQSSHLHGQKAPVTGATSGIDRAIALQLARNQVYEFLFIGLPLKIQGATGSTLHPIAAVPEAEKAEE